MCWPSVGVSVDNAPGMDENIASKWSRVDVEIGALRFCRVSMYNSAKSVADEN
jgi:hypothetical protein